MYNNTDSYCYLIIRLICHVQDVAKNTLRDKLHKMVYILTLNIHLAIRDVNAQIYIAKGTAPDFSDQAIFPID